MPVADGEREEEAVLRLEIEGECSVRCDGLLLLLGGVVVNPGGWGEGSSC